MADIPFYKSVYNAFKGNIDFDTDTIKCALLSSSYTPNVDHGLWVDVSATEIAASGGYNAGGQTVTLTITADTANDKTVIDITDPDWLASGIITARYAIVYDDTPTGKPLLYLIDLGADKTATAGAHFKIIINDAGLFYIN